MSEQTQQPPAPAAPDNESQEPEHHFQHEADKTELEKWLKAGLSKVEPYSNYLLIGFIGVAVILVAGIFWTQSAGSSRTAEWEEFVENRAPEDYIELAEKSSDSPVGAWALLQAGRGFLQEGMRNSLSNREVSDARLQEASDAFEKLLNRSNAPSTSREEALLGLGTAREVLEGGNPSSAIEAYQKLVDGFPESRHVPWAMERINELQKESTQEFYAWFRKQNPKPGDRSLPSDFLPKNSAIPELGLLDLLEDSKLNLPPAGDGDANTNKVPTEEEMKKEAANSDEKDSKIAKPFPTKEGDEKPAEKPKAETPKEKEAEPKPAEEKAAEVKKEPAAKTEDKPAPKEASEAPAKPAENKPETEAEAATPEKSGDDK